MSLPPQIAASVVVCTISPWEKLKACLDSLLAQELPGRSFEILVVDNAPQPLDAKSYYNSPLIRCLREPKPGLSFARNTGALEASGEIIVYVDDDITAPAGWLASLLEPFADPAVGCVGGRIELVLPQILPSWYDPVLDGWWSRFEPPPGRTVVRQYSQFPYGANLAIRKSLFQTLGGFDVKLGRRGFDAAGGEDLDICLRAMRAGVQVITTSQACVNHHIAAGRITREYLWKTSRQAGLSLARLDPAVSRIGCLRKALVLFAKGIYPFARMPRGRRLNYFLHGRMYLAAALS